MRKTSEFAVIMFTLPGGNLVLQRRTLDAPYGANKLSFFGGWVEKNESPMECIRREIPEETSLVVGTLDIRLLRDFMYPKGEDYPEDRHFYLYAADIPDAFFNVFEGQRAEVYKPQELKQRNDLTAGPQYFVDHML